MKRTFTILLLFISTLAISQKSQTVTVKSTTNYLVVSAAKTQPFRIVVGKDTFALNQSVPAKDTAVYLVNYLSIQEAIAAAQLQNKTLVFPAAYTTTGPIHITGDIRICAAPGSKLYATAYATEGKENYLLYLHWGKHEIYNLEFVAPKDNSSTMGAVQTEQSAEVVSNNIFSHCRFAGDWGINYQSTLGHPGNESSFYNCNFFATIENIQYYNQAGPKLLRLYHDTLASLQSDNIYSHPNSDYDFNDVLITKSGKLGLHSYTSDLDKLMQQTGYQPNHMQRFVNCWDADTATSWRNGGSKPMWEFWSTNVPVYIDSSNLPPYETASKVVINNSNIYNAGNGSAIGYDLQATNCTGAITVRAGNSATIINCNLEEFYPGDSSRVNLSNCSIGFFSMAPHFGLYNHVTFNKCFDIGVGQSTDSTVIMNSKLDFQNFYYGKGIRLSKGAVLPVFQNTEVPPVF